MKLLPTDYGRIRVFDTGGNKPVVINVPDGPNVIEHQEALISQLSRSFRVICFELPGIGFSYPTSKYDYSFLHASRLIINMMDSLNVQEATLAFSCSNSFYAIQAAEDFPHRITHLFLSQTASLDEMNNWTKDAIPNMLMYPLVGQMANAVHEKRFAKIWYKYALPRDTDISGYQNKALRALSHGGCFCLSSLVQGLKKEINASLKVLETPSTLIWGKMDYTHKKTNSNSIKTHLPNCEVIEFSSSGHFPELEETSNYVRLVIERLT